MPPDHNHRLQTDLCNVRVYYMVLNLCALIQVDLILYVCDALYYFLNQLLKVICWNRKSNLLRFGPVPSLLESWVHSVGNLVPLEQAAKDLLSFLPPLRFVFGIPPVRWIDGTQGLFVHSLGVRSVGFETEGNNDSEFLFNAAILPVARTTRWNLPFLQVRRRVLGIPPLREHMIPSQVLDLGSTMYASSWRWLLSHLRHLSLQMWNKEYLKRRVVKWPQVQLTAAASVITLLRMEDSVV